ncbi:MAG: tetratricopeptide repeat protein [Proteiniphilum sp.]|jgi:tetratricopeptide (TPR) repeat protein|nr:tetratricopeptide repeat protein [Proteiniphilum sp.]MDD3075132.1 tetratricopeptide repeat protein [Proteiniphilum sp.]MDD3956474.1 tetratricopeptide repeat protein [Proteiniphilum sp.]
MRREFDDSELDITSLVEKYEQMRALGKKYYFDADEFALLAEYYNSGGDNEEAEELISEGLKMHPGSPELMLLKVKTLVYSEMYEEALDYIRQLSDDEDVELALLKIECLLRTNQYNDADDLINKTLEHELSVDDLYYFITEIGYLLNDVDKFDRSITFLEESLKVDDSNIDVMVELAYAYEMKGDLNKAIEYNNLLLDMDPYSYDGWVNIGRLYSLNEQYDKSIDAYDFALTIQDGEVNVLKMKALSLFMNDNAKEAIAVFEKCLQLSPDDESLYDSLLEAYEAMGQYEEMMKLISKKEASFGNAGILAKEAFVHNLMGDLDKAEALLAQIPDSEKETFDYYMLEGELAFQRNNYTAAEAAYMKAALISENNEDILDKLINISVAQGKYEQAADYLEELLHIAPDFPSARTRLAFMRFEIGTKEPFDEIIAQFSDEEIRTLLDLIMGHKDDDFSSYSREKMIIKLNEARENRVLFKNIKY